MNSGSADFLRKPIGVRGVPFLMAAILLTTVSDLPAQDEPDPLSRSLIFPTARAAERLFLEVDKAVAGQEWSRAAEVLHLLFESPPDLLVNRGQRAVSPVAEADDLFGALPQAARDAYLRHAEPFAADALRQALAENDVDALRRVAGRYRRTPSGERALRLFLSALLDRGAIDEAGWFGSDLPPDDPFRPYRLKRRAPEPAVPPGVPDEGLRQSLATASWTIPDAIPANVPEVVSSLDHYLRENGLAPSPVWNAVALPDLFIVANGWDHRGYDRRTGETRWILPSPVAAPYLDRQSAESGDSNRFRLMTWEFGHRVFRDSLATRMTLRNDLLYVVQPVPLNERRRTETGTPAEGTAATSFPANGIVCLDTSNGAVLWRQSGDGSENLAFFCAPLSTPGGLFVPAESESSQAIDLWRLDPQTGRVLDRIPIARSLIPLAEDRQRQGVAGDLRMVRRHIFVQTAAGAVAMVDPLFKEVTKGIRTPRRGGDPLVLPLETDPQERRFHEFAGWGSSRTFRIDDSLYTVAPDSDEFREVSITTLRGSESIKLPSRFQEIVADDDRRNLVLLGPRSGLMFESPHRRLNNPFALPLKAGSAAVRGLECFVPHHTDGIVSFHTQTGEIRRPESSLFLAAQTGSTLAEPRRLRNLFKFDEQLLELSLDGLRCTPLPYRDPPTRNNIWIPDEDALAQARRQELGVYVKRLIEPAALPLTAAERRHFCHLLAWSVTDPFSDVDHRNLPAGNVLTRNERAEILHRYFASLLNAGQWDGFAKAWLDLEDDSAAAELVLEDGRRCRLDRWLQAELQEMYAPRPEYHDRPRPKVDEAPFLAELTSRLPDDTAGQLKLLTRVGRTFLRNRVLFHDVSPPRTLREWIGKQLALIEASRDPDPSVRAEAYRALIALDEIPRDRQGIQAWIREMATLPPETCFPSGESVRDWLQAFISTHSESFSAPVWPDRVPSVRARSRNSSRVFFSQIPVQVVAGDLYSRMNLEMDWPGCQGLRFSGSAWTQEWIGELPPSRRVLRSDHELNRAWGIGRLCVLQTGSELFGLCPFEFNGDRGGNRLWPPDKGTVDTLGGASNVRLSFLKEHLVERPGYHGPSIRRLNEFEHPAASVGPVAPTILCYQEQGMLVALDPATGTELWRRYELPPRAWHFGNERTIVQVNPVADLYSSIDPIDGRIVIKDDLTYSESVVDRIGATELQAMDDRHSRMDESGREPVPEELLDPQESRLSMRLSLTTTNDVAEETWNRDWPGGSFPVRLDDRCVGVMEPSGRFEILDFLSGVSIAELQVDVVRPIERVGCAVGRDDLLIAFSTRVEDPALTNAPQRQQGHRRMYLDGEILSVDRQTGKLRWRQTLRNTVFPLDQPCDFPVFVTAEARYPEHPMDQAGPFSGGRSHGSVLRVYDRRTGEKLYENESTNPINVNYVFHNRIDLGQLVLRTRNTTVEFDFSDPVGDPSGSSSAGSSNSPKDDK